MKPSSGSDALAWVDAKGKRVTDSQYRILCAAECAPNTSAAPRLPNHHQLVEGAVQELAEEDKLIGGGLGRPSGARFRAYGCLDRYAKAVKNTLFDTQQLHRTMENIYRYPLREAAAETLNRQIKSGADDGTIARLAMSLREEGKLNVIHEDGEDRREAQIICSLGLAGGSTHAH